MQEYGQWRFAHRMGLLLLACSVLATSGCASAYHLAHYNWLTTFEQSILDTHRPYFHSGRTGRIIAKHHRHSMPVEPDCFGYEPTCWYNWPSHCVSCPPPDQIVEEEVVEPQPMQGPALEQVPQQQPANEGLEGILDLDDPKPGEQPILPNRGRGASVVPPATIRQVAPEPRSSSRPSMSVTKQESIDPLMRDRVVDNLESTSSGIAAYKAAISRRRIHHRMELVEEPVRPGFVNRDDRPLAFVDRGAEVAAIAPNADVSLPTNTQPAPPAIAPSVVQSDPAPTSPSLVQATPPSDVSSRRTIQFAPATANDQVTIATTLETATLETATLETATLETAKLHAADMVEEANVEPKAELAIKEQPAPAVPIDRPAAPAAKPVQTVENDLPATLNEEPVQTAKNNELPEISSEPPVNNGQEVVSLPSFKIIAVAPHSADEQVKTAATSSADKPATSIRFVSGTQPKAVRVSARDLTRGEASSDLKFR